jgi:two-component system, OmpR family, phosphate regulon sensor histidine kinase PhoR
MPSLRGRIALAYCVLVLLAMAAAAAAVAGLGGKAGPLLALLAILAVAAATLLGFGIARAVTRPLARLLIAARALEGGSMSGAVSGGGGAEVDELVGAFNEMAASLRQTLQRLEQARSSLAALLASSQDAIVALDAAGAVRYLNPAAAALYGSVEGRSFAEVARDPALTSLLRSASLDPAERGGGDPSRTAQVYIDHRDAWVQATASAIAGGGDWAVLVVLHDITEVRRSETTRRDFVANVSHELRTPLAGIKAVVETLQDGALEDRATALQFLGQVDAEVDRLVQLVEELLQLARIESATTVEMEEIQPREVLAACLERFRPQADRAGVTLLLVAPMTLPLLRANASQLGQAVGNLVHNAIKFTPAGGQVTVSAQAVANELRICVADTGGGIDAADLPRIFERFYVADLARSGRGTGLGLAIVKHVVRAHEGSVEAQSTPGAGSTFTMTLPLDEPESD